MTPKNFLVSGMGRSGTMFLAQTLNRSKTWIVEHEQPGDLLLYGYEQVADRFDRAYYGEVNGCLRFFLEDIPVARKAVILRDPREILLSAINRRPLILNGSHPEWIHFLGGFGRDLDRVCWLADRDDVHEISFARMTSNVDYLVAMARWLGIEDLEIDQAWLDRKINATKIHTFSSFDELPKDKRAEAKPILEAFAGRMSG